MATVNKGLGPGNATSKVAYHEITPGDMKNLRLAALNNMLLQLTEAVNGLAGYNGTVMLVAGVQANGDVNAGGNTIRSFVALIPSSAPIITGSKGANAALTSLLKALNTLGLVVDQTT